MGDKNLLITIIDTNPIWWGLKSSGLIISDTFQKPNNNLNTSQSEVNKKQCYTFKLNQNLSFHFISLHLVNF